MTIIIKMNPACFKFIQAIFMVLLMLQVELVCAEEVRCVEKERQALLNFKAGLVDVDGILCLSSWGAEEDKRECCQWKGVGCSNQTSHIEILDIGNCHLSGEISTSLMDLQHLKYLNLSFNHLEGSIPYQLGNLSKLQVLDLSMNGLLDGTIPSQLGMLSSLQKLDLSLNWLGGSLPSQLGNLSKLQYLNLSQNDLGGSLPSQLGNISKLQVLDLSLNWLGGSLPSQLGNLSKLQYLNLSQNDLGGSLPSQLGNISKLQVLDLNFNGLEGTLPSQLGKLSSLQYLDLGWNNLAGSLPSQLGNISMLQFLDLSHTGLEGTIPSQLGNLTKLQFLDLSINGLEGTLPSQLGKLSSLQKLLLDHTDLKFDNGNHMGGQWLSNLTSLTHLDLSGMSNINNSHSWLQMIGKLPKLTELVLQSCNLSDNFCLSLDHSKFTFPTSLTVLDLSWNPLKSFIMKSFMNICSFRSLIMHDTNLIEELSTIFHHLSSGCVRYSLQELDLNYNQITGTLPDLSIFPSLKILSLTENRLRGKIPDTIRLPSQFESLDVGFNSLEGGIPKSFRDACTLRSLRLFANNFSEELPAIIHHLSGCARHSLQELYLDANQINGTLPDLSTFSSLEVLYLGENRLNGKIPENIRFPPQLKTLQMGTNSLKGVITDYHFANMSKLKFLNLSDNSLAVTFSQNWVPSFQLEFILLRSCKLGPSFPKWLQTQFNFVDLDISNAGISDNFPEWFWDLTTKMFSMDISHNNLTGTIPNFPLRFIQRPSITLAANQFEGPIPLFLRSAVSLDLSGNKFSDYFLFLCANNGRYPSLEKLDLSRNRLSGQIPDCWNNFISLAYLDLSNNNLSGQIPSTIGSALKLQALILRNNSLIGKLPSSLRSCTKLVMLDVGENKLLGLIPFWIGSTLQQLQMLSLRRNHFCGNLPLSLCYLSSLHLLDLSSNNLKGQIPKCFKNFSAMAEVNFSLDHNYHDYVWNLTNGLYSYDLIALMMWKGVEHIIKNGKLLLKGIDLSSNQLTKDIPSEIEDLVELVSLNLSRNNLSGKIPSKIGRLTSLEFLDLSRNHLAGSIPSSLTQIDRLTMLDLSHNHLSGEIPTGTQLQSFDASSYEDNLDLCGRPLQKLCKEKDPSQEPLVKFHEDEDSLLGLGFYISLAVGFVIGFWGIFGSILVNRSWRHTYFRFLNNLTDDIYVRIAVTIAKYKRRLND